MQNRKNVAIFLGALLFINAVWAADSESSRPTPQKESEVVPYSSAADAGIVKQLEKLQTEVTLLKAETARASAQADLDKASGVSNRTISGDLPLVRSIYGRDRDLNATVGLQGGGVLDVVKGQQVPGGYKVSNISVGQVTFVKGNRTFDVGLTPTSAMSFSNGSGMTGRALMVAPPMPSN